ncbi:erythrocyte membrane protein 1, PfEMP1, putative [Plasmodium reichenowi]|uniref:Erythrocyte membrane protein 1, PfEMP1, putative n=1 Tax=Plasmodium reichenowi TaxID=5854 RepID=A0A2P9D5Y2_PLARE|nr:erythrocyte membrane protein 1, PfEMP1, putative [Plasmodium reichenowi]
MGPQRTVGGGDTQDDEHKYLYVSDAKDLLDRIGEDIYKKANKDALARSYSDLHGHLTRAQFSDGTKVTTDDPCKLKYEYDTYVTSTVIDPCKHKSGKRLSKVHSGECDKKKIKDSEKDSEGACAPFRRLHVCDKNLEQIQPHTITATDNLLLDVCMAAQFEGDSIRGYYPQYDEQYPGSGSTTCTVLARSFADIGDIIRGKDLYRGGGRGREKLDKNLQTIFAKIYEKLDRKYHYEGDSPDYFKLREDWWDANRQQVWKAITCGSAGGKYFRNTCGGGGKNGTPTLTDCRCIAGTVPTYFDYVPQFLRWFEEWAEDFCRKRKKKIENAIKNCRYDESGEEIYCDLNGYDCTQTARGKEIFVEGADCKKCSVACNPFGPWIDNQKEEFQKQKEKYDKEISKTHNKTLKIGNTIINNLYVEDFYKKLKIDYGTVNKFLQKLSDEKICQSEPQANGEKADPVDFKNENVGELFSSTKYCQACPLCGVKGTKGKWEPEKENCRKEKERIFNKQNTTDIPVLTHEKQKSSIIDKYKTFCNNTDGDKDKQIETWQCHYEHTDQSNNCILGDWKNLKKDQKVTSYNVFFYDSIIEMLKDSIGWRERLKNCLQKDKKVCISKCNSKCKCYKQWVDKKKDEWDKIKEHFYKQKNIEQAQHDMTLKLILNYTFLQDIKEAYPYKQQLARIEERLKDKIEEDMELASQKEIMIEEFLEEELKEATKCVTQNPKETCDTEGSGRILRPSNDVVESDSDDYDSDEEPPTPQVTNPCSGESGNKEYPVVVHKVAEDIHKKAHAEMVNNSVVDKGKGHGKGGSSKSSLEGHIENAEFNKGHNGSDLKEDICNIDENKHSNRDTTKSNGPCHGKGEGFKIGETWKPDSFVSKNHKDVYMPPRRQHMCTSNLEKINVSNVTRNGKGIHSLLGDVLLSANKQADWIKKNYTENNNKKNLDDPEDKETVCSAIRYSFADIGDIVRGKDMWDNDGDQTLLQEHLQKIFSKIKDKLPNGVKEKYTNDNGGKHTKLRADWWTANRRQVWNAMQCENIGIICDGMPDDDYIPQRLRWMTEWAEWYCKAQKKEYKTLQDTCKTCKNNGQSCWKNSPGCTDCEKKCKEYQKKIKDWADQWGAISKKYQELYNKASGGSSEKSSQGSHKDKDENDVVEFLKKIKEKYQETTKAPIAAPNTPYQRASGYIHQELPYAGCQEQNVFCTSSANEHKDKYAFSLEPHEYKDACDCTDRTASTPQPARPTGEDDHDERGRSGGGSEDGLRPGPPSQGKVEETTTTQETKEDPNVCNIVNDILSKDTLEKACPTKYGPGKNYGWLCVPSGTTTGGGKSGDTTGSICVPPRRRKLYISPLSRWASDETKSQSQVNGESGVSGSSTGESQQTNGDSGDSSPQALTSSRAQDPLLAAFVESAAVETFFLWHRYKKEWEAQNRGTGDDLLGGFGVDGSSGPMGGWGQKGQELGASGPSSSTFSSIFTDNDLSQLTGSRISQGLRPFGADGLDGAPGSMASTSWTGSIIEGPQAGGSPAPLDQLVGRNGGSTLPTGDLTPNDPSNLNSGTIPPPFLRQMFYTLGDYRDICVGVNEDVNNALEKSVYNNSSDDKNNNINMKEISTKIKSVIEQSGNNNPSPVTSRGSSSENPSTWWQNNAEHIWKAMICALTYKENNPDIAPMPIEGDGKTTLERNDEVYSQLFSGENKTLKSEYQYKTVQLKEDQTSGEMKNNVDPTINNPTLTQFVERPPFFRWLHEWGNSFCSERQKRLEEVKKECVKSDGGRCSGDGLQCKKEPPKTDGIIRTSDCPSCGNSCRWYKKWIKKKGTQYDKQEKVYGQQKEKAKNNKDKKYDDKFVQKLSSDYDSIKSFLQKLGPCSKKDNKNSEDNEKYITDFDKPQETFEHTQYCDPCPVYGVKCKKDDCSGSEKKKCDGKTPIGANDIEEKTDANGKIEMLVSDDSVKEFDGLTECDGADIFTGIRKDVWKCGNVCGVDVCGLKKKDNNNIDSKQIILINAFVRRWVENFLADYNKIRKKLKPCMNNVEQSACISGCEKKCDCVKAWITKKRTEWQQIRERYLEQYKNSKSGDSFSVRTFLEELIPQIPVANVKNDQEKVIKLSVFDNSCGCKAYENSINGKKEDAIDCMLKKLEKKIEECKKKHDPSGESPQASCKDPAPVGDDDYEEENEEENPVTQPNICPAQPVEEVKEDEKCDEEKDKEQKEEDSKEEKNGAPPEAPPLSPESSSSGEGNPEQTPVLKPEEEAPAPEVAPTKPAPKEETKQRRRTPRQVPPSILPEMLSISAFPLSVGIAFAAISYFLLKKKTRRPVDMFSVLEIPQNDYEIPTFKSKNRYIPYKSAQYRGKRYIYLEGDSGTDSGYTDHYSDITSSSESEYEELDINDIYVPGSPKYKTLIEVVLEPSKRDTQNDIPSDNTPTNKLTDNEWNQLKDEFISQYLQSEQNDVPNDYTSGNVPLNTQPKTLRHNADNNTHSTMSRHNMDEKPFIMSIHDRNLYTGEEISYDMNTNNGNNDLYSGIDPRSVNRGSYSGIDLINDTLSGGNHDIYDEILKRKEKELFGTKYHPKKHTTTNHFAKPSRDDTIHNQLELFHKWLDRHRDMCEKWENKVDILNKLKEEWNKDNNNSGNKTLNSDVSIQIDMDDPKPINQYTNMYTNPHNSTMDTIMDDLEKYNGPYYDIYEDDIYYDVNDDKKSADHINMDYNKMDNNNSDVPTKVQIEMNIVNNKKEIFEEEYPISDIWNI